MSDRAADVSTQTPSPWKQRGRIGPSLIAVLGSGHGRSFSEVSQVRAEPALDVGLLLQLCNAKHTVPCHSSALLCTQKREAATVTVESASNSDIPGSTWQAKDGRVLFSSLPGPATSACSR